MYVKVGKIVFDDEAVKVEMNTCDHDGKRDYVGYATIPAESVTQYKPGEVYELALVKVEVTEVVKAEAAG